MTTPNPQARALELLEVVSKATPGPWHLSRIGPVVYRESQHLCTFLEGDHEQACADAYAVAHLPDLATELRAALDRETAAVKEIQSLLECMRNMPKPPRRYVGDAHGCDL